MKKTISGRGLNIELDTDEVVPHDPGAGTPAMVMTPDRRNTATYWCALNEGELDGIRLSSAQVRWLEAQEDAIIRFLGL